MKTVIVDYGLGNIWSVRNAFEFIGVEVVVSSDPDVVSSGDCLVLPGVGHFGQGMRNLRERGLVDALNETVISRQVPLLGICLGMQLLADQSEEAPGVMGLGWVPGEVSLFHRTDLRLPHIGFNDLCQLNDNLGLFSGVSNQDNFYFVHSYCFTPSDSQHVLSTSEYGQKFVSAVKRDKIIGVQFHPEKSQSSGLKFISNFVKFASGEGNG
jgi:imidazole glycerol phosphate synthase glutamine amidotransferase subunit